MKLKAKYDVYDLPPMSKLVEINVTFPSPEPRVPPKAIRLVPVSRFQMHSMQKQERDYGRKTFADPVYYCTDKEEDPTEVVVFPCPSRGGTMSIKFYPPLEEI